MFIKCLLIALVYTLGNMDTRMFGANRWNWPISLAVVIGLVAGDVQKGVMMSVELQMIFLGFVAIGMSTIPDGAAGTTLAVAFAVLNGIDSAAAIALAMPVALLFQPLQPFKNTLLNIYNVKADQYAAKGDEKGVERQLHLGNLFAALFDFVPMFLILFAGSQVVETVVNAIPTVLMNCLSKTSQILPALGVAYLMTYVCDKFTMPFVFLGFALSVYLGMDSLGVAIIGGVIAVVYFNVKNAAKKGA